MGNSSLTTQENPSGSHTAKQHMQMPLWYCQMKHAPASLIFAATETYLSLKTTRYTAYFTCREVLMPLTVLVGGNIILVLWWPGLTPGFHTAEDSAFPCQEDSLAIRQCIAQGNLCPAEGISFCVTLPGTLTGEPSSSWFHIKANKSGFETLSHQHLLKYHNVNMKTGRHKHLM